MGFELFDIITIIISVAFLLLNIKKVRYSTLYIIYLFFFGIYVLPLCLDYIIGFPSYFFKWDATNTSYNKYTGFILSYQDTNTRILYDVFILAIQFLLLYPKRIGTKHNQKRKERLVGYQNTQQFTLSTKIVFFLSFLAILPIVISLSVGYTYIPFIFGWRENPLLSAVSSGNYYSFIERLSYIGLSSSMICMMLPNVKFPVKLLMLALCYMNICIESKRSLLFFAIAVYVLLKTKGYGIKLDYKKIGILIVLAMVVVVYQSIIIKIGRGYSEEDVIYTNIRIDLFRDDTARLIIYSFIYGPKPVLDFPFQSYLTEIAYIFPLDIINGLGRLNITAIGFNRYVTTTLIQVPLSSGEIWMTTSMIDEVLANFSFFSIFIVPFVLRKTASYIDQQRNVNQVLWLSAIILTFMYSLNYIVYYLEFLILINFFIKKQRI